MPWTKSCASSPTVHRAPSILCRIDAVTQRWQPVLCTDFAVGALRGRIQRSACAVRVPRPQFKAIEPHALPIIQAMSINGSATDRRIVAAALGAEGDISGKAPLRSTPITGASAPPRADPRPPAASVFTVVFPTQPELVQGAHFLFSAHPPATFRRTSSTRLVQGLPPQGEVVANDQLSNDRKQILPPISAPTPGAHTATAKRITKWRQIARPKLGRLRCRFNPAVLDVPPNNYSVTRRGPAHRRLVIWECNLRHRPVGRRHPPSRCRG